MKSLVWFRSDLRMDDNPALKKACQESHEVHAVYLYSKNQHKEHNEANIKIEFLIQNLFSLEENLQAINFYLKNGFEKIGIRKAYYTGNKKRIDALRLLFEF